jgi:antitoxin (DNA-binding transcriptional repressor) of toxin-antitoxin stability system
MAKSRRGDKLLTRPVAAADVRSQVQQGLVRATLPTVVERVRGGTRFTVVYRSRPAFQLVPVDDASRPAGEIAGDPLYRVPALGRSTDGRTAADHDRLLYAR